MPFKSQAQRRKFAEMMVKGEISPETFEEWNRETGSARLPERVARKRPKKRSPAKKGPATKKRTAAKKPSGARKSARPAKKKAGARKRR